MDITDIVVRQLMLMNVALYLVIVWLVITCLSSVCILYNRIRSLRRAGRGFVRRKYEQLLKERGGDEDGEG